MGDTKNIAPSRHLAARLGPIGLWTARFDATPTAHLRDLLPALEDTAIAAIWVGEGAHSKEAMSHAGVLLGLTRRVLVVTGIANIWARDAVAMASGARVLAEAHDGRFVLGLGVSHAPNVESRGYDRRAYVRPLQRMRSYLDAMDTVSLATPAPVSPVPILLAALRPRMLHLAAERTMGAHPFFVTVEHTARARNILGPEPVLAPQQAVVFAPDRSRARAVAQEHVSHRLERENYRNHLLDLGFSPVDLDNGGSDSLFDSVIAWGDIDAVAARIRAHLDAGADHVAIDVLVPVGEPFPLDAYVKLGPAALRH